MVGRASLRRIGTNLLRNQQGSSTGLTWQGWRKCSSVSQHSESTQSPIKNKSATQPPLTEPLSGLPTPVYATLREDHQNTNVTTLSNGLRVASENRFGQFCTIGVVVDSGSRYEVAYPSGISHYLEKLAFNSTTEFSDKDKILAELEKQGGICDCQSSRDTFVYAASADSRGMDSVVRVLGEVILRPQISLEEIISARQALSFELETLYMRPEQEPILMDMIHAAAYRDNTLGLPKIIPEANLSKIDRSVLFTYLKHHYTPKRMVVAGVGVDHNALVASVEKYFVDMKPIWEEDTDLVIPALNMRVDNSIAQYTGGMVQEECSIPLYAGMSGLPELAHVVVGLEGCSHQDPDFIPICVLNMMMGGGGSFSAGGPGKGMYTRLYTNVLNRHHWMYSATAYNHAYVDTGLFCIHASAPPAHVHEMTEVLVKELVNMAGVLGEPELERAKRQLQSMLLMNLEARPVVFEDIARQVLATGKRKRPEHFIKEIDKVTVEDIQRVARQMLKSQPAVAARGEIRKLPAMSDIQAGLLNHEGRLPGSRGRLSLFR
ncbi:mitochondrial-processing peptidase subunit alpha [Periplaneta americana]|uniref:mitochondrial-processing peptidase subunit alpha n=1 Tax=Periplaneta americana TaxID=6978 RepID=UPI0037E70A1B